MKKLFIAMMAAALVVCSCKPKAENAAPVEEECTEQCCEGDGNCCKHECCGECQDENGCCKQEGECCEAKEGCKHDCCKDEACKGDGSCQKECKHEGNCCEKAEGCKHECCKEGEKCQGGCAAADKQCVYCGACSCPMEIDIAKINELYDKAVKAGKVTPELQKEYNALKKHASDCVECGSCTEKCPKGIDIPARMKAAAKLFGK